MALNGNGNGYGYGNGYGNGDGYGYGNDNPLPPGVSVAFYDKPTILDISRHAIYRINLEFLK